MTPRFLSTVDSANEWPYTSTGPVWKLRMNQVNDMHWDFFVCCLLRQRNGGLNSGQKSANIVIDVLQMFKTMNFWLDNFCG